MPNGIKPIKKEIAMTYFGVRFLPMTLEFAAKFGYEDGDLISISGNAIADDVPCKIENEHFIVQINDKLPKVFEVS